MTAFCTHCIDAEDGLIRTWRRGRAVWLCPSCMTEIGAWHVLRESVGPTWVMWPTKLGRVFKRWSDTICEMQLTPVPGHSKSRQWAKRLRA